MTKSELREMIRSVLKEELSLRENVNEESSLETTLDKAYRRQSNILIITQPGLGTVASVRKWCNANSVHYVYVNARNKDVLDEIELASTDLEGGVLIIDEYNRATSRVRAELLRIVNEHSYNQDVTVGICNSDSDYPINEAERNRFTYKINCYN